jgi:trimethylamine--corrinoid protein Co-methyltransferase
VLDAQAGAETATGALLAVLSGIDSASGPGMLDDLLTFSLPKLVLDDELAGQALHFGRDIDLADDIPSDAIISDLLSQGQVVVADHTLDHWSQALHVPGEVYDRDGRERWVELGEQDVPARAEAEVERLLAAWEPPATDPALDAEARAIIAAGLPEGAELPADTELPG